MTMAKAKIKSSRKSAKKASNKGKGNQSTTSFFGKKNPFNFSEMVAKRKRKSEQSKAKGYCKKKKALFASVSRQRKKFLKPKLSANFPRNAFVMDDDTPWFRSCSGVARKLSNVSHSLLPGNFEGIDPKKIQQLSLELSKFHTYCTLREVEKNARQHIMNTIQELCREQWGSDAKVQNYGSFAVGSICTFSSDIDLALWGVVPTEEETHHNHFTFPRDPWKSDVDEYIADDVSTFTMDADDGSVDLDKEYEEKASSTDELDSSNNEPRKKTEVANSIVDLAAFDESSYPGDQTLFFIDTKPMGQTTGEAVVEAGEGSSLNQSGIDLIDCKGGSYRSGDAVNSTPSLAKGVKESCNNIVDEFEKTESHDARKEETNWQVLNDDGSDYNDDVEVSYFSKKSPVKLSAALSDEMRLKVNAVLKKIDRKCRKRRQFTQVTHIKSAKVPIMQSKTVFNFECDLSIGGHNGSDTNNLARHYTSAYNSFSVVTVFLKMLLRQADLDKPFTGGLGSYRLYVMIAFHIERHLRDGGADNPTELLLGFLHRYGLRKTDVVDNPFVACEQGGADLSGVYRIELCVELFHLTYEKLRSCLVTKNIEGRKEKISIVAQIVDSVRLHKEREGFIAKAKLLRFYETKKGGSPQSSGQKEPRKVVKSNEKKSGARKRTWAEDDDEAEAERLIRGYKMRRGPRGSLIPLQRPDLIHKKQQSPEEILLGRASKKRKNKKKQNRDKNLRHLARSEK